LEQTELRRCSALNRDFHFDAESNSHHYRVVGKRKEPIQFLSYKAAGLPRIDTSKVDWFFSEILTHSSPCRLTSSSDFARSANNMAIRANDASDPNSDLDALTTSSH
jgi:hypothetical protein